MSLKDFTQAYLEAMFWAETDNSRDNGGDPMEDNYSPEDLAPEARAEIEKDCAAFYDAPWSELWADCEKGYGDEQAGHDFYLTRNHHGAGFWDRGLGEVGDRLTEACKPYGTQGLYVGDDGKVYTRK
jgi:hypothetical protein